MKKRMKYKGLNPKQQKAIIEIIKGNCLTYKEIARKSCISTRTLHRWRNNAIFQEALEESADELRDLVLKTSGMVIEVNALSTSITRDAELLNFAYLGDRVAKLEKDMDETGHMNNEILKYLLQLMKEIEVLRNK